MSVIERTRSFLSEVRRRKVFRAASIYLVAVWTLSLGVAELFPAFGLPSWAVRLVVIAGVVGFPLVVATAWLFEITSEGVLLDRVARSRRRRDGSSRPTLHSATTMWAKSQHVIASWEDGAGRHQKTFSAGFIMGRDRTAELCIDDPRISRLHARVSYQRGQWWIEDLASRNGTSVDGRLINEPTPLAEAAEIRLYEGGPAIGLQVRRMQPAGGAPAQAPAPAGTSSAES